MRTRVALRLAAAAALTSVSSLALAQAYPSKPVRVISSASPGTSGDAALRMMALKMSQSMGQPVVVELQTAARGAQAFAIVGKAAPDGHTLTYGTAGTFEIGRAHV